MEVGLITVGDELLDGDTENSNATWLATQLTDRGVSVERILALPDDRETIAEKVSAYSDAFDAVVVTGGTGGTPDDVTMAAVADAFGRDLAVDEEMLADVEETIAAYREKRPSLDIDVDTEAEASLPAGSRPLANPRGLAPGCVVENVYVMPGIPEELRAMFGAVGDEFAGESRSKLLYTLEPESNIAETLDAAQNHFDVTVGCYPDRGAGHNRLKLTATDTETLAEATEWLHERVDASETPVSRDREP